MDNELVFWKILKDSWGLFWDSLKEVLKDEIWCIPIEFNWIEGNLGNCWFQFRLVSMAIATYLSFLIKDS